MSYRYLAGAGLVSAVMAAYACGSDEEGISGNEDGGGTSARQTVEITLKDFSFTPGKLQVEAGQELEIKLTNSGDAPHTFTIEEFDVDAELQSRAETTVLVTPAEAGRFTYYCRFHEAQQMEGALTVGDQGEAAVPSPTSVTPDDMYDGY
jgi:plastocyanin